MPAAEQAIDARVIAATAAVTAAKAQAQENQAARRELEKEVAGVDSRMARFESHKAAVKTNQEYQALNHEIAAARTEKDAVEEKILVLMESADELAAGLKSAEAALAQVKRDAEKSKTALGAERQAANTELARLATERAAHLPPLDKASLATYEQLLKNRRGIAVAGVVNGHCTACHVRLRPHVEQKVRRNEGLITCDSCNRILYYPVAAASPEDATA